MIGRERIYLEHFWNDFAADPKHSLSEADRRRYAADFAHPRLPPQVVTADLVEFLDS